MPFCFQLLRTRQIMVVHITIRQQNNRCPNLCWAHFRQLERLFLFDCYFGILLVKKLKLWRQIVPDFTISYVVCASFFWWLLKFFFFLFAISDFILNIALNCFHICDIFCIPICVRVCAELNFYASPPAGYFEFWSGNRALVYAVVVALNLQFFCSAFIKIKKKKYIKDWIKFF